EVERVLAQLPAVPGLLVPAERRRRVERMVGVDPHGPGLDPTRESVRPLEVVRPDAGREAVDRAVRELDRLIFVPERHRREDGPEDLLPGDRLLGRDALEDRGPDPVPPLLATV